MIQVNAVETLVVKKSFYCKLMVNKSLDFSAGLKKHCIGLDNTSFTHHFFFGEHWRYWEDEKTPDRRNSTTSHQKNF